MTTTITTLYHKFLLTEVGEYAGSFLLPIVAVGAGAALVGWGVFAIISEIQNMRLKKAAKPQEEQ